MSRDYLNDKSWMYVDKRSRMAPEFLTGVTAFMDYVIRNNKVCKGVVLCPCTKCRNNSYIPKEYVDAHIVENGFVKGYTTWTYHGEDNGESSQAAKESNYCVGSEEEEDKEEEDVGEEDSATFSDEDMEDMVNTALGHESNPEKYEKYLNDARRPIYENAKCSSLAWFVQLFQIKCLNRWSNKSFSMLLEFLQKTMPSGNKVPKSWYEAQKKMSDLGLTCEQIHACPNDCVLYWKENAGLTKCPTCKHERYKQRRKGQKKQVPLKLIRYFPITPRLQRLFRSRKTAEALTWHSRAAASENGTMSHPRDSPAWKEFDLRHPEFSSEPRNIRFGLASDGFNPFSFKGSVHSTWPVIMMNYNMSPWLAMDQSYFMMPLLIDGPKSPGNNIDVYLRPLIEELKHLWTDGVVTYDANTGTTFRMRVALMWTVNDLPAYGMLSGWTVHGFKACPYCHVDTMVNNKLPYSNKPAYFGHRRFLPADHPFRINKRNFNGCEEHRLPPVPLTGIDVINQWHGYDNVTFGIHPAKQNTPPGWNKKSIFFELPYWKTNLVRHNLDVMHIEKGVSEHILNLLLCKDGKSNDNLKARMDLKELKFRKELHPIPIPDKQGKFILPNAIYHMSKKEKSNFLEVFHKLKVPEGFSGSFSKKIKINKGKGDGNINGKIDGLNSHDHHVILEQLLPLSLRASLPDSVSLVINEMCSFFRELCTKSVQVSTLEKLDKAIPLILCKFERIFPPSFFDVIIHLTVHLAAEAMLAGPVQCRWMYFIERYLLTLKRYIRNANQPEGSIAQGHLLNEVIVFCSDFLDENIETKLNRNQKIQDGPHGRADYRRMDALFINQIHKFILLNCDCLEDVRQIHKTEVREEHPTWNEDIVEKHHLDKFCEWLPIHARCQPRTFDEYQILANFPRMDVTYYKGFGVGGYKFEVKELEECRATQNSGVATIGADGTMYYGYLDCILAISYPGRDEPFFLFQCTWYDTKTGTGKWKGNYGTWKDEYGLTSVNTCRTAFHEDPYIFPEQAIQVYYSDCLKHDGWRVVCQWNPRDVFNVPEYFDDTDEIIDEEIKILLPSISVEELDQEDNDVQWVRNDFEHEIHVKIDDKPNLKRGRQS